MGNIVLRQLTEDFYNENNHLKEILDKLPDGTIVDKGRGYGIVLIDIFGHKFAIPLRSEMTHKSNYPTKTYRNAKGKRVRKGLDYSKAVIIKEEHYVSSNTFFIPNDEYNKISKSEGHIIKSFSKYVSKYINGVTKSDNNILKEYRFSTLQNYHNELGIAQKKEQISP